MRHQFVCGKEKFYRETWKARMVWFLEREYPESHNLTIWSDTISFTEEKLWQDNLLNWGQDKTQQELHCSVIPSNIVETLNVASSRLCKFIKFSLLKKEDMRVPFSTISWESNFHPLGGFIRFVYLRTLHNEENYKYSALTLHSVKEMLWKILIVIVPERSGIV